ncbi:single-stranded DNA-binding protein [Methylomonas sp. AM2-LC]|uniref:single-stranded DNA-binding protein n=1 Tax=Methylomonas sp. AM2-LC TaxID=3153301 RepID=UPI003267A49B
MYFNKHLIVGRIGREPDIRVLPVSGKTVANFSVATTDHYKDKHTGEWTERTEWHNVVVFGKTADYVRDYVKKGQLVLCEGPSRTRKWTHNDGGDRYTTEIHAEIVRLHKRDNSSPAENPSNSNSSTTATSSYDDFNPDEDF